MLFLVQKHTLSALKLWFCLWKCIRLCSDSNSLIALKQYLGGCYFFLLSRTNRDKNRNPANPDNTLKWGMGQHDTCPSGPLLAVIVVPNLTTRGNTKSMDLNGTKNMLRYASSKENRQECFKHLVTQISS